MFADEGPLENTTGHMVLEKKKGFNYCTLLDELMYAYITCCPDIGYVVTTLSKFSSPSIEYYYMLLKEVTVYFQNTIEWRYLFSLQTEVTTSRFPTFNLV